MPVADQQEPDTRLVRWVAHAYPTILVIWGSLSAVTDIGTDVFGFEFEPPLWAAFAPLAGLFYCIWCSAKHQFLLCQTCADDTPLVPERDVQRYDASLRLFHNVTTFKGSLILLLIIIGSSALHALAGPLSFLCTLALWGTLAAQERVIQRHRVLRPWCPYCRRWDDDGDEETAPVPPPVGHNTPQ